MYRLPLLSLAAAVSLLTAAAAQQPATTLLLQTPAPENCPVGLAARHADQGATVRVDRHEKHPGQGYRISLTPQPGRSIVQARITLHGISGEHVLPAGQRAAGDATESFSLVPAPASGHLFHSTVYVTRLTGVQWVELNEVVYGDGTRWHQSPDALCRVAPDGFMLVSTTN